MGFELELELKAKLDFEFDFEFGVTSALEGLEFESTSFLLFTIPRTGAL